MRFVVSSIVMAGLGAALPVAAAPSKSPPRSESEPPLVLAAWRADHDRIDALLEAGEDPNARGPIGLTPWMWSLIARDRTGFERLFDSVRDFRPADPMTETLFLFQVVAGDQELVRELLRRGVSVDARANDGTSALMIAAASGRTEMVALLLERGAQVSVGDRQGDTALMSAVRAGSIGSTRLLLARGAAVDQADGAGRRALDHALRSGREDVLTLLRQAGARPPGPSKPLPVAPDIRTAVGRSVPLLERAATEWIDSRGCNACHLQPVMLKVNTVARAQGFAVDPAMRSRLDESMREEFGPHFGRFASQALASEDGVTVASLHVGGDQAFNLAQSFASALDAGLERRPYDRESVRLLARMQQADGSWRHGPDRVPLQSGDLTSTALGARVLAAYAGQVSGEDLPGRVARARAFLLGATPRNTDDAAFRLLGLRWLGAEGAAIDRAAVALRRRQLDSGGWAQEGGLNPDAYATGLALVALAEGARLPGSDPAFQRGVAYLLRTQEADGSWLVHKRSVPVNRYFESGFPHGKFQFSSFLGTAWATMALMYGQPAGKLAAHRAQVDSAP